MGLQQKSDEKTVEFLPGGPIIPGSPTGPTLPYTRVQKEYIQIYRLHNSLK